MGAENTREVRERAMLKRQGCTGGTLSSGRAGKTSVGRYALRAARPVGAVRKR